MATLTSRRHTGEVYIIIPVYNEGQVIADVVKDCLRTYQNVICVDDGSTDNSVDEIRRAGATLVCHPINLGQGAALQTGIDYSLQDSGAGIFVTFDADGQHSLADVAVMIERLKSKNLDIVLGSRFLGSTDGMPATKKFILKSGVLFSRVMHRLKLTDTHNGLRVFNRRVAENLKLTMDDFSHASEILDRIASNKFKYEEAPVKISYTEYSKSKGQPISNVINTGFNVLLRRFYK